LVGKGSDTKSFVISNNYGGLIKNVSNGLIIKVYEYPSISINYYQNCPMIIPDSYIFCSQCREGFYGRYFHGNICDICYKTYPSYLFAKIAESMMVLHRLIDAEIIMPDIYAVIMTFLYHIPL